MTTKQNPILSRAFVIVFFTCTSIIFGENLPRNVNDGPNNPNIHSRQDPNFQTNFSQTHPNTPERIELLKKRRAELLAQQNDTARLSPDEIYALTIYAAALEQQIVLEEAKVLQTDDVHNFWSKNDIIAYVQESKQAFQKALLERLIQTKRNAHAQVHRIRKCLVTSNAQQSTVPVSADTVFALAAGAAVIEKIIVTGATAATGLYVGTGKNDPKNNPLPKAPTPAAKPENTKTDSHTKPAPANQPDEQETQTKAAPQQTSQKSMKKDVTFSQSDNANQQAVNTFQAQKAHNQEQKDRVIEGVAFAGIALCQQYKQHKNRARKEKQDIEWAQEKEADIQKRMRASSKSRFQIEEEDRLFLEKFEKCRQEERRQKEEKETRQHEEKKNKKSKQQKKPRQNDCNRTSNSGPGKDPDKGPNDDKNKKRMKYTGNAKHHINSKKASKPPHNGQKTLERSKLVRTDPKTGLSDRVATENGKVVKFHEHAPGEYHGYIEENVKQMDDAYKNTLYKAGLIRSIKSCKVIK